MCGWGQSARSSTDRPPSYIQELIHVTGGSCHSAACGHLAWSPFHLIKCAYGYGVPSAGRRHNAVQALDYVRDDI